MRAAVAALLIPVLLQAQAAVEASLPLLPTTFYPPVEPANIIDVAVDRRAVGAADAQLMEDGKAGNHAQSVREFRATAHGVSAVLAIDASGSVKGGPFESVKTALSDFVSSSRPQDRIAIVSFADTVEVRQPFTSDKAKMKQAIAALEAGGNLTLLNQAILNSLMLLAAEKTNTRRRLLVITDGKNEGAGPDPAALRNEARRLGIPVDCLGVTRLPERFLAPMQSLAAASGGTSLLVKGYEGLRKAMGEGIAGLLGTPVLTFRLAHIKPDGANHLLQVRIAGSATGTVQVFMPRRATPRLVLYISVALAALLFCAGLALILYSRRRRASAPPRAVPETTSSSPPPVTPTRPRVETVYAPPPEAKAAHTLPVAPSHSPAPPVSPVVTAGHPVVAQPAAQTAAHATQFRQIFKPPTTGQPSAWLRAQGAATRFPIDSAEIWIGAAEGNRIRVAEDLAVSWNHACVQWAAGDLYLFDNRSTNGTSVNGHRMEAGSRVRLQAGDRIEMGRAVFLLET